VRSRQIVRVIPGAIWSAGPEVIPALFYCRFGRRREFVWSEGAGGVARGGEANLPDEFDERGIFRKRAIPYLLLFCVVTAQAQLAVTVSPVKIVGQKAVVPLAMKNNLTNKVESARAVCFLLDDQGKMIGQSTQWVIGQNKTGLAAGATNTFNFVITSPQPWTSTDLTAKVSFSRVILAGGKLANPAKDVSVTETLRH
jgi:hypothetical protein